MLCVQKCGQRFAHKGFSDNSQKFELHANFLVASVEECGRKSHVANGQWEEDPVQHAILFGEHELTIDDKNRLLVPAELRKALDPARDGDAFFLVVGINRKPWFYPEKIYQNIVEQAQQDITPDEDLLAFDQMNFAMAARVEWDKQGRIVLPEKLLRRTGTGKEVTLIGARNHLELWNRQQWEERFETLLDRSNEVAQRARQARKQT